MRSRQTPTALIPVYPFRIQNRFPRKTAPAQTNGQSAASVMNLK